MRQPNGEIVDFGPDTSWRVTQYGSLQTAPGAAMWPLVLVWVPVWMTPAFNSLPGEERSLRKARAD